MIGTDETQRVLAEGDTDEVKTLICNPHASVSLLKALYEHSGPFSQFDEERWAFLVFLSRINPRVVEREDSVDHDKVLQGIFNLLSTAATTPNWLFTLHYLLEQLDPQFVELDVAPALRQWALLNDLRREAGLPIDEEPPQDDPLLQGNPLFPILERWD